MVLGTLACFTRRRSQVRVLSRPPFKSTIYKQHAQQPTRLPTHFELLAESKATELQFWSTGGRSILQLCWGIKKVVVENGHHGLLNDLVLQHRNSQWSLSTFCLRNIDPPRGLCPVRSTTNTAMQIGNPTLQSVLIPIVLPSPLRQRVSILFMRFSKLN